MFLHLELDGFPMHIGGLQIYDQSTAPGGKVRFKDILAMFAGRLGRSPIFRRRLVEVPFDLDQPYWVDDEHFELEFHVRHIALPRPGDWRQLCIQVARLHARPLDRQRPLWEAYVIEGLNHIDGVAPGSFALYVKVHHAAMDGASGTQFFGAFNDATSAPAPPAPPAPWRPEPPPGAASLLARAWLHAWARPRQLYHLLREIPPMRRRLQEGREQGRFHDPGELPATRFGGKLSRHRVLDAVSFDFEEVRALKKTVPGATINDVALAIVAGALRKYLASKGELPAESLVAGCPVDVREESERESGGNMIGMMSVRLPTDVAEPAQRLQRVHDAATEAKAYTEAVGPRISVDLADSVPIGMLSGLLQAAVSAGLAEQSLPMNTLVTNVPGAPVQLYLCGAQLVDSFGIGPLFPGLGLFHTVNSAVMGKRGRIIVSFVACREVMPDPAWYAECLRASFAELREALLPRARPAARPRLRPAPAQGASRRAGLRRSRPAK